MQFIFLLVLSVVNVLGQSDSEGQFAEVYVGDEGALKYSIETDETDPDSIIVRPTDDAHDRKESLATPDAPDYIIPPQMFRLKRQIATGGNDTAQWWQTAWRQRHEQYQQSKKQQKSTTITVDNSNGESDADNVISNVREKQEEPTTESITTTLPTSTPDTMTNGNSRDDDDEQQTTTTRRPRRKTKSTTKTTTATTTTTTTRTPTTPTTQTTTTPTTQTTTTPTTTTSTTSTSPSTSTSATSTANEDEGNDETTTPIKSTTSSTRTTQRPTAAIVQNKVRRQFSDTDRAKNDDFNSIQDDMQTDAVEPVTTRRTTTTTTTTTEEPNDNTISDLRERTERKVATTVWPPILEMQPSLMEEKPNLDPRRSAELRQLIVDKHNRLRSVVSPPAANMLKMEWNMEAQENAQRWAEQCKFEHDPAHQRDTTQFKCGQNLARGWPKPLSWDLTQQLWFDERKDFNFDSSPRGMVGHYTQLVWAQSYQVGCGYHDCGTFHHYVCNYCPPGNVDSRIYRPYKKGADFCESCPGNCEDGRLCTNTCSYSNKFGNCDDLDKEFQICSDTSYGLDSSCQATCKCQNKIY